MDSTQIIQALILGIVEGLTEFLPVSSTGHLLLAKDLLGFESPPGYVFEISIQLGAILAICWKYRQKLLGVALTPHKKQSQKFITAILLAFLPAAVIGATANDFFQEHFFNSQVIAISLILGGIAIILIENFAKKPKFKTTEEISHSAALRIGFIQVLSIIPGISRSGATIMGGLLCGLDRKAAAEFSFFLGIPTIFGATAYTLYKNWSELQINSLYEIGVGFIAAFISGFIVVNFMIAFVSKNGFKPFAYYRIALGLLILASL